MSELVDITEWLSDRRAYPDRFDGDVVVHETHISWVFLAGDYAYKVKKPVRNDFLDYSTLAKRKRYCYEELRLNRRFTDDLYLSVVAIVRRDERIAICPPEQLEASEPGEALAENDELLEFAVKMRRFPEDALLSHQLMADQIDRDDVTELATRVARFHESAARSEASACWGSPESVLKDAADNLRVLSDASGVHLTDELESVRGWTNTFAKHNRDLFNARVLDGFIRECHGDLHLDNVIRWRGVIQPFDGIEFSDRFRWIDVLSDVAFLVMDFAARDHLGLGRVLLNRYLEATGDYRSLAILRWYLVYRAMVRAKVATIRHQQGGLAENERQQIADDVRAHIKLAEGFCSPSEPRIWITHGFSGSGKTFGSESIIAARGAIRVRSDVERKRLHGVEPTQRPDPQQASRLYSQRASERTYEHLAGLTERLVRNGFPVVVDAAFLRRKDRQRFCELAESLSVPFGILDFNADESLLRSRIQRRQRAGHDASDAGLAVLERQLKSHEPLTSEENGYVVQQGGDDRRADDPEAVG